MMGRRYNTKHPNRSLSNYMVRLHKRGLGKTPVMEPLETLRRRQRTDPPIVEAHAGWDLNLVDMSGV